MSLVTALSSDSHLRAVTSKPRRRRKANESSLLRSVTQARPSTVGVKHYGKHEKRKDRLPIASRRRRPRHRVRPNSEQRQRVLPEGEEGEAEEAATRPKTVSFNFEGSGVLARERSMFMKEKNREDSINRNLARREKKTGSDFVDELRLNSYRSVKHGNKNRYFYNSIKTGLSAADGKDEAQLKEAYKFTLALEVLTDNPELHFDILERRLVLEASQLTEKITSWSLKTWKIILAVVNAIYNIVKHHRTNNMLLAQQRAISVLVRAACADLFWPKGGGGEMGGGDPCFLPKWDHLNEEEAGAGAEDHAAEKSPLLSRYIERAQKIAFDTLALMADDKRFRATLVRTRVLEVALLIMGGRKKQIDILDSILLTQGVPKFQGTPAQLAAMMLVKMFSPDDYNLMSRFQQSRDVGDKFKEADEFMLQMLLPKNKTDPGTQARLEGPEPPPARPSTGGNVLMPTLQTNSRPSTVPVNMNGGLGLPFYNPKHVIRKRNEIRVIRSHQLHIVRGEVSGARAVPTWGPLADLLKLPGVRDKLHQYAEEEFEFFRHVEERRLKKQYATRCMQIDNNRLYERRKVLTRQEFIKFRCSPEGVMEDILRRNGRLKDENWWDSDRTRLKKELAPKKKPKKRPPVVEEAPTEYSEGESEWCFEFKPPEHVGPSPFGECASNGLAWWENYLIKKPFRPDIKTLAAISVDVEADVESLVLAPAEEQVVAYSQANPNPKALHIPRLQPLNVGSSGSLPHRPNTAPHNKRTQETKHDDHRPRSQKGRKPPKGLAQTAPAHHSAEEPVTSDHAKRSLRRSKSLKHTRPGINI